MDRSGGGGIRRTSKLRVARSQMLPRTSPLRVVYVETLGSIRGTVISHHCRPPKWTTQ